MLYLSYVLGATGERLVNGSIEGQNISQATLQMFLFDLNMLIYGTHVDQKATKWQLNKTEAGMWAHSDRDGRL